MNNKTLAVLILLVIASTGYMQYRIDQTQRLIVTALVLVNSGADIKALAYDYARNHRGNSVGLSGLTGGKQYIPTATQKGF